jgi:hypothetical protein
MSKLIRKCPFYPCKERIEPSKFACPHHWQLLSKNEKDTIWEAFNAYQSDVLNIARLREIQQGVIDAVQKRSNMADLKPCSSCKAMIIWVRSAKTGALMPLDAEPNENGNVAIVDGRGHVISGDLFEEMLGGVRYTSHFATCPFAAKHRDKRGH